MYKIHPQAAVEFDRRGIRLLDDLERVEQLEQANRLSFQPNIYVSQRIELDADCGFVLEEANLWTGKRGVIFFRLENGFAKLKAQHADDFRGLVQSVVSCRALEGKVTEEFIGGRLIEWLAESANGRATEQLTQFLERVVAEAVKVWEVWIPIANMYVESDLRLGEVTFRTITPEFLERRDEGYLSGTSKKESEADVRSRLARDREELQGLAAGVVKLEAESGAAHKKALAAVEESLAILRVCHPANRSWSVGSRCLPLGSEHDDTFWAIGLQDGSIVNEVRALRWLPSDRWLLSNEEIKKLQFYVQPVRELLEQSAPTPFQEAIRSSLSLYSRSNVETDTADKLVYILVALETLLLRNSQEMVQQNVAERFAFLSADEAPDRIECAKNLKDAYGLRSRYLHHGHKPQDVVVLESFFPRAWEFFLRLPEMHKAYRDKEELVADIERRKFS